jgi:hypothetical protein
MNSKLQIPNPGITLLEFGSGIRVDAVAMPCYSLADISKQSDAGKREKEKRG